MNDYPPSWKEIADRRKAEEGYRCERCRHSNRPSTGHTLTVHHLDGDKSNNTDENLAVLCQRCHLRIQRIRKWDQLVMPWAFQEIWLKKHRLPCALHSPKN